MTLVDTSVWVDHLRSNNAALVDLLESGSVLVHPFVIGEIALGSMAKREIVLDAMRNLPSAKAASDAEVWRFIDDWALYGRGIGYVDVHLLAAACLTPETVLWTMDKRLGAVAAEFGLAFLPERV